MVCILAWPAYGANNVPDLSGFWEHTVPQEDWENLPSTALGPVHRSKASGAAHKGGTGGNLWIGDYTNPILQPWAAGVVKDVGDRQLVHLQFAQAVRDFLRLPYSAAIPRKLSARHRLRVAWVSCAI